MISIGFCTLSVIIRQQKQNLSAKKSSLVENSNRKYKKKTYKVSSLKYFRSNEEKLKGRRNWEKTTPWKSKCILQLTLLWTCWGFVKKPAHWARLNSILSVDLSSSFFSRNTIITGMKITHEKVSYHYTTPTPANTFIYQWRKLVLSDRNANIRFLFFCFPFRFPCG